MTRTSIIPIVLVHDTGRQIRINTIVVTVRTVKNSKTVETAGLSVRFVVILHWVWADRYGTVGNESNMVKPIRDTYRYNCSLFSQFCLLNNTESCIEAGRSWGRPVRRIPSGLRFGADGGSYQQCLIIVAHPLVIAPREIYSVGEREPGEHYAPWDRH